MAIVKKNLRKGIANFVLIVVLYIGIPILFIVIAPLIIPTFKVSLGLIIGIIIIGLTNSFSFFLRGYFPPKTMPHILGGLVLCIFSGIFFMFWLVIGSGIEISTEFYVAKADLGIISQLFVWILIGTSVAFLLELFHYYKKLKNYKIIKIAKIGFLIANLIVIGLLGILIFQMAMTRYGVDEINVHTQIIGSKKYYNVDTTIYLSNSGFIPIKDVSIEITIYVEDSSYFEKGFILGKNTTSLEDLFNTGIHHIICNATSMKLNNTLPVNSILIKILFFGKCFGAAMEIQYIEIEYV
ncbi:MAG: hypothetical protein ACTSWR_08080 [Candidatus Helarchaeota archaeon]